MTREEMLKWLKKLNTKPYSDFPYKPMNEALDMAIKTLEQEPKWVPVSERMPEKNVWVLTTFTMTNDKNDIDIKRINRWNGQWEDEFDFCNTVIAWMPLPKPYELQESEE